MSHLELLTVDQDTDDVDIPVAYKRQLLMQDVQMWKNTRWQAMVRYETAKTINDAPAQEEQKAVLDKCSGALLHIRGLLAELPKD